MKMKLVRRNQGFTIIEVMIVLAIAGLILAVVLLAVPALQRSQRNSARSSDAVHLAGLVSDYISNHGGQNPPVAANCNAIYSGDTFSRLTACAVVANATTGASNSTFIVDTGATCVNGAVVAGTNQGSVAIAWQPETTGAASTTCVGG
jgi:prepilin-type N-terminal cleavage/methylation domain-containing protein